MFLFSLVSVLCLLRPTWSHQMDVGWHFNVLSHFACYQNTFLAFHVSFSTVCCKVWPCKFSGECHWEAWDDIKYKCSMDAQYQYVFSWPILIITHFVFYESHGCVRNTRKQAFGPAGRVGKVQWFLHSRTIHKAYGELWEAMVKTKVSVQTGKHCPKEAKAKPTARWNSKHWKTLENCAEVHKSNLTTYYSSSLFISSIYQL